MKKRPRRARPTNNVGDATFGGTKNAAILSARLLELGNGRLTWKLKKRFAKTMQAAHCLDQIDVEDVRLHFVQLLIRDTVSYVDTIEACPKDIRDRFLGAIRNQICRRDSV